MCTCGPEGDDVGPACVRDALGQSLGQEQLAHEADVDARGLLVPRQQRHVSLRQAQQPQHLSLERSRDRDPVICFLFPGRSAINRYRSRHSTWDLAHTHTYIIHHAEARLEPWDILRQANICMCHSATYPKNNMMRIP